MVKSPKLQVSINANLTKAQGRAFSGTKLLGNLTMLAFLSITIGLKFVLKLTCHLSSI